MTDILEDMSFKDGEEYNEKLIPISRGEVLPDRKYLPIMRHESSSSSCIRRFCTGRIHPI